MTDQGQLTKQDLIEQFKLFKRAYKNIYSSLDTLPSNLKKQQSNKPNLMKQVSEFKTLFNKPPAKMKGENVDLEH